jgi:REP element-mobilizing transposase RayT
MARRARHSLSGAVYHVMMRGNNRQSIFSSDSERCRFCLLMQEGVERYGHRILAFCFMNNHVHLAIQLGNVSLSKICQNLAFRYTRFYNRIHRTIGHLFQGRFKSILVNGRSYLRKLIRYIHLNPVRAYITDDPLNYQWSSHQAYLMQNEFTWLERDTGLQFFGESRQEAMKSFHHFIMSGIGQDDGIDFKMGIEAGIIGDDLFIERMLEEGDLGRENRGLKIDLKTLLSVVVNWYDIDLKMLRAQDNNRRTSQIRAIVTFLARDICNEISLKEIASFFCRTDSSLSQAATRLEIRMRTSEQLKNEIGHLKQKLFANVKCEA